MAKFHIFDNVSAPLDDIFGAIDRRACTEWACTREHVHVFTDDELDDYDTNIIFNATCD